MFIDIHTHHSKSSAYPAIQNLTFAEAEKLFSSDEEGLFSVGFHPWQADEFSDELLQKLKKWAEDKRFVMVGECGLDKNGKTSLETQIQVFEKQIILSEKIQKPMIIHCVGYFNELFALKKQVNPSQKWIIHGFRGKPELATQALKAGFELSFGEHFNPESIGLTPIDKLFVETDESNSSVAEIYRQIALIKKITPEELIAGELLLQKHFSK